MDIRKPDNKTRFPSEIEPENIPHACKLRVREAVAKGSSSRLSCWQDITSKTKTNNLYIWYGSVYIIKTGKANFHFQGSFNIVVSCHKRPLKLTN